ncbi:hypothetical protein [Pedobacter alpinus]|uniref:Uncharacterized protein n=1 Tax=Pedobacter alpinus TaxID=1590643 RepID=A0ABW5TTM4_9SPHI
MANTLDAIIEDVSKSLGKVPHPISIILQTQGVISNGFVSMAPRRSEFYTIPGQEFDAQDWLNSLAVHELRHVVQFDKVAPYLKAPLFEELKLALFGINLPPWFFEGDAVGIETSLTQAGRGRQPSFELALRANELSGKSYSYTKNYLGSFKNLTSGYYPLGYFMTTKIRRDNGTEVLDKILERIKNFPIRPYNFSNSLKKFSGVNTRQLYENTITEMDSLWTLQNKKVEPENYEPLNQIDPENPSSYLLPYFTQNNEIICLKNSLAEPAKIISINQQKEEKTILKIGFQTEPNLSYANNKLTWDEYRSDSRFDQRNFSVICTYDLITKKYKQLSFKSRLFSPSLSPDGKKIIAVNVTTENIFSLIEFDAETGAQIKTFPNPQNYALQTPSYNAAGNEVIVTGVNTEGKTLLYYHNNGLEILLKPEAQIIARPVFYKNQILYKAHYNGLENIYSLNPITKEISSITNVPFGANYPSVDNDFVLFSNYSANGYNLCKLNLNNATDKNDYTHTNTFVNYFSPLISQENKPNIFNKIPEKVYPTKNYSTLNHLFYFHSARVTMQESDFSNSFDFGFDLVSNNKLNTVNTTVGYNFNNALNKSEYNASIGFLKYYPKIAIGYTNKAKLAFAQTGTGTNMTLVPFYWRENRTALNINVPTFKNWLNKSFYTTFELETSYTNRYQQTLNPVNFNTEIKFPMTYGFTTGINSRRGIRDLAPKWGQNLKVIYENLPFDRNLKGENINISSVFYFPGLMSNHSFRASLNWQKNSGIYNFSNDIPRANGWANMDGIMDLENTFLLSYLFPISYPDWELGPIAYIKRLKGGVFSDFENINNGNGLRGYGISLSADMNLLRYYLPNFEIGGKLIIPHKSITKNPILEFTFNYNF